MPIQILLFDLDGTIVDTILDITNALNFALQSRGMRELSVDETKALVGEGITRLIEKVLGEQNKQFGEELKRTFLSFYTDHLIDHSSVYPDVGETLDRLADYRKAVISNKREYQSSEILSRLNLRRYFDIVAGSDTTPERKPSAVPLLHVIRKFGALPEAAVMIGDSTFDIEAGKRAGVKTVAVTYGYQDRSVLESADYLIDRFSELPAVLDIISS